MVFIVFVAAAFFFYMHRTNIYMYVYMMDILYQEHDAWIALMHFDTSYSYNWTIHVLLEGNYVYERS